ncbi:hypothetical protein [Neoroseomonas lacus]|uniref:Uncharacterized protein n=1 Tax=Neoroseomonas lacus TaxID=287609 RepID=A0A917KH70_9PROT|nr:hypothetical protein [Neoroseomonas lacus]GGJ14001.1 hypothetical protein GCM10011320_21560 [Neoroseomonas lacus]
MTTFHHVMDTPLTVLMRVAVRIGAHPDLRAEQEQIVAAVQALEAVRIGVAHMEGAPSRPEPATISPCAIVDLGAIRAARADGAVRL